MQTITQEDAKNFLNSTQALIEVVESLKPADLDRKDHEGWTPRQVVHHLADSEAQAYARLRRLIAEPGTSIQGYDEGKWAENSTLGYTNQPIESSIAVIKAVRQSSYELILRITDSDISKEGVHTESGRYTVEKWLQTYTNHAGDHARQIQEQLGK